MRVIFMGTPEFAVPSLRTLVTSSDVVGVFTRPDAVSGRGARTRPSPVKRIAEEFGLRVFEPPSLRDESAIATITGLGPDLIVVAAYGLILPVAALEAAPLGAVNVHASLLPRWRGAAPIQRAILAGDERAGVSIMRMEQGLDTGPYCVQRDVAVGEAGAAELTARLAELGAEALAEALPAVEQGTAQWIPQDETLVTYAEKISKGDVAIEPGVPAAVAWRRVRASLPASPCRVLLAERGVTLLTATLVASEDAAPAPGVVSATKEGVVLGMADGGLLVTRLKPDGKGEMAAADWARGVRGVDGAAWDAQL